jgi:hypothetical protein
VVALELNSDLVLGVLDAADDVARGEEQAAQHELLDRVRVRARRVEHRDAARRHLLDRDVVGAGAAAGNSTHARADLVRLQLVRAPAPAVQRA